MQNNTETLQNYIVQQIQLGQSPDEIHGQLVQAGWAADQLEQAFKAVQAGVMPTSLQTSHATATTAPAAFGKRRGRIRVGWVLLKQSTKLLDKNRYLLRYMLMTWVAIILIEVALVAVVYYGWRALVTTDGHNRGWWYVYVFMSYLIIYTTINYYAAALSSNILDIFQGHKQPYAQYLRAARSRALPILVYSIIESLVGMFLRLVVERIRFVGWLLSYLLGTVWSLGTMFVLPIIMNTEASAPTAIKQSVQFFKKTWGENIVAKVTVNAPLALINIALQSAFMALLFVAYAFGPAAFFAYIIIWAVLTISLAILGSFANNVLNVALYFYACTGQVPPGFTSDMLNSVFVPRKSFKKAPAA